MNIGPRSIATSNHISSAEAPNSSWATSGKANAVTAVPREEVVPAAQSR